jgi:hypothetical protein
LRAPDREPDADDDWWPSEAVSFRGRALEEPEAPDELEGLEELEGAEGEAPLPSARGSVAGASSVGVISFFSLRSSARWSAAPTGEGVGAAVVLVGEIRPAAGPAGWSAGAA